MKLRSNPNSRAARAKAQDQRYRAAMRQMAEDHDARQAGALNQPEPDPINDDHQLED